MVLRDPEFTGNTIRAAYGGCFGCASCAQIRHSINRNARFLNGGRNRAGSRESESREPEE
jgi:hypothetical protein